MQTPSDYIQKAFQVIGAKSGTVAGALSQGLPNISLSLIHIYIITFSLAL